MRNANRKTKGLGERMALSELSLCHLQKFCQWEVETSVLSSPCLSRARIPSHSCPPAWNLEPALLRGTGTAINGAMLHLKQDLV